MKILISLASVVVIAATGFTYQQRDQRDDRRPGPPSDRQADKSNPRGGPYLDLFDTNHDGEISTKEIEAAISVLRKLDRNRDGKLTRDELPRPPRPGDSHVGDRNNLNHSQTEAAKGTVLFNNGYQTDRRDGGRPVALIAAALGVKPQVFRDAFSKVRPSRSGPPSPTRARMNKDALMKALGRYGITNDRLDEVSNYYRYRPESGRIWRHSPATATAIVKSGKVTGFKLLNAGSGYLVAPTISVAGYPNVKAKATIEFSRDFSKNGRITSVQVIK